VCGTAADAAGTLARVRSVFSYERSTRAGPRASPPPKPQAPSRPSKAERLSFDVPTLPLFVHERLSTKAILETDEHASAW